MRKRKQREAAANEGVKFTASSIKVIVAATVAIIFVVMGGMAVMAFWSN